MKLVSLEDTQQHILRGAKDAFVLIDASKRYLSSNDSFAKMSGYRKKDLEDKTVTDLFVPRDRPEFSKWLSCVWSMGQKKSAFRMLKKNGRTERVELSRWPIKHKGTSAVLLIFRSLQKEEELTRKLSKSEDRYQERARELKIINEIGRAVNAAVDLKTLLMALATEIVAAVPCDSIGLAFPNPAGVGFTVLLAETAQDSGSLVSFAVEDSEVIQSVNDDMHVARWTNKSGDPLDSKLAGHKIKTGYLFPIASDGVSLACLLVFRKSAKKLTVAQKQFVQDISLHLAVAIKNATYLNNLSVTNLELVKTKKLLEQQKKQLEQLSNQDGLTGLVNQTYFKEQLDEELERAVRFDVPLSLIICDVDFFKQFNDNNGHFLGDGVLKTVASIIKQTIRNVDIAARYGGDEFAIILPHTKLHEAEIVARRLVEASEQYRYETKDDNPAPVTLSVGVAVFPRDGRSLQELVESADAAMYRAKELGRDRVSTSALSRKKADKGDGEGAAAGSELEGLMRLLENRPAITEHAQQRLYYASAIAKGLQVGAETARHLRRAVALQDIGKIGLSEATLAKSDNLTKAEASWLRKHPDLGANIIRTLVSTLDSSIKRLIPIIEQHHEQFDGKGYPKGLKGDAIRLEARIMMAANDFTEFTVVDGFSVEESLGRLRAGSGKQYDPAVVEALEQFMRVCAV
ncbi:MAG: diguanylate cyclase [Terriglobia bacterium]